MRPLLLAVLLIAGCASSRPAARESVTPTEIVTVGEISEIAIRTGATTVIVVPLRVADGYHVQANPASGEFLIPLVIEFDPVEGLRFGQPRYPEPVSHQLDGSDDILATYEGELAVEVPITAVATGRYELAGRVSFQACDARRCLFPSSTPVSVTLLVEPTSESALR